MSDGGKDQRGHAARDGVGGDGALPAANRMEKGRILDALCATTGWHRKHAVRALRQQEPVGPNGIEAPRERSRRYGATIKDALTALWEMIPISLRRSRAAREKAATVALDLARIRIEARESGARICSAESSAAVTAALAPSASINRPLLRRP